MIFPFVLLLAAGVLYYVARQREGVVVADSGWDTGVGTVSPPSHRPSDQAANPEPHSFRVALALGRVEARHQLSSPLLVLGLAFSIPFILLYLDGEFTTRGTSWAIRQFPLVIYPYCGMVLLATNRAVLRGRRDGTEELFGSLPVGRSSRTSAHLLSLVAPVAVGALNLAVLLVSIHRGAGKANNASLWSYGGDGLSLQAADFAYILQSLALIACAGALGIAVARLVPSTLAAVGAIVIIGVLTVRLNELGFGLWAPFVAPNDLPMAFFSEPGWWHAVYLVGLGAIAVGATWVLDGNRGRGVGALIGAAGLIALGALGQEATLSPSVAAELADQVSDPTAHQVCETHGASEYCAWPEFKSRIPEWAAVVEPVLAATPPEVGAAASPVVQRLSPAQTARLEDEVIARLDPASVRSEPHVWPEDTAIHPGLTWYRSDSQKIELAAAAGTWAVGLPTTMTTDGFPCYVSGQARGVVAVWLAGQALDLDDRAEMTTTTPPDGTMGERDEFPLEFTDLGYWGTDQQGVVVWDRAELALAGQLLALPDDEVGAAIRGDWDHWTDPATTSAELAGAFGLVPVDVAAAPEGLSPC